MRTFTKFIRLTKVDATQREVYGIVTSEAPDKDGEICDYPTTVPYYQAWSAEFDLATGGKSRGNVREMHTHSAVGKVVDLVCDDAAKSIAVRARIVDDDAWTKCEEGVYTGFSHGGEYVGEPWPDGDFVRYTAKPSEIPWSTIPATPRAHFEYVKADGSVELRKFVDPPLVSRCPSPVERTTETEIREREAGDGKRVTVPGGDPAMEPPPLDPTTDSRSPAADSNNAAPPAVDPLPVSRSQFPVKALQQTADAERETQSLAKAVLEHQQQIADLAGAVRNLAEAMAKLLAEPQSRKTVTSGVIVTKEQDGEIANHNPQPKKSSRPQSIAQGMPEQAHCITNSDLGFRIWDSDPPEPLRQKLNCRIGKSRNPKSQILKVRSARMIANLTEQTMDLLKKLQSDPVLEKVNTTTGISTGTGVVNYNLEPYAKTLYPVITPIRNKTPRFTDANGGNAVHWKVITAINPGHTFPGTAEGIRGGLIDQTTDDRLASFVRFSLENSITEEAIMQAQGFDNALAIEADNLLRSMFIMEEEWLLVGNGPSGLPLSRPRPAGPPCAVTVSSRYLLLCCCTYLRRLPACLDRNRRGNQLQQK